MLFCNGMVKKIVFFWGQEPSTNYVAFKGERGGVLSVTAHTKILEFSYKKALRREEVVSTKVGFSVT